MVHGDLYPAVSHVLGRYALTLAGAAMMYAFASDRRLRSVAPFLRRILPARDPAFYARADAIIVTISGSIIGFIVFAPDTPLHCLAAGFGWIGAMNTYLVQRPRRR
jgi:hypothetical protein